MVYKVKLAACPVTLMGHGVGDDIQPRIVGGQDATEGLAPYQISMRVTNSQFKNLHFCSGAIINERWILTAAHSLIPNTSQLWLEQTCSLPEVTHTQLNITLTMKSLTPNDDNDISLIKLAKYIQFNDKVQRIEMATSNTPPGTQCLLTGWGFTGKKRTMKPDKLQMLKAPTISIEDCQKRLTRASRFVITEKHICTLLKRGKGSCQGDSGGPLVKDKKLVGVTSRGIPCARGYPDTFTIVAAYQDWIKSKMEQ
ncbi:unnamed protein product [Pieris brassicae]|uniref:Peptidase S1 domain-containing protein n=1 Tax=Pieris brassicae TaxID=7116 RepID=A0A9P0X580_PIEBR|nr:unnamed protein product [Pieris brassicae]